MKIKQEMVLVGLMAGLAMHGWSVGFDSNSSRRLEVPHLRKESTAQKSSSVYYSKSQSEDGATTTSSRRRRRQAALQEKSSLLPESFDAEDSTTTKASSAVAKVSNQKVLSAEGHALKDDIKVEYGEGHGETFDEALKEAMKDVLQKVVGVYVDSDFRMNNDEIIKDEIITHSNGFIDHYKKMEEAEDTNGRGKVVTIKAWVKMRDFVNRMKKIAPKQTVKVDGVLLDNELDNNLNAEALLRKEFDKFDPITDLMEVRLVDSIRPEIQSSDADSVVLRYVFVIRYSKEKYYQQFVPRLSKLLDQIALKKQSPSSIEFKVNKIGCYPLKFGKYGGSDTWRKHTVQGFRLFLPVGDTVSFSSSAPSQSRISLVYAITKGGIAMIKGWRMPEHLMRVYDELRNEYFKRASRPKCIFTVFDANKGLLSQSVVFINYRHLLAGDLSEEGLPDYMPFMGSHLFMDLKMDEESEQKCCGLGSGRPFYDRFVGYVDITIDKTDVKRIKSAEIKLEAGNQGDEE